MLRCLEAIFGQLFLPGYLLYFVYVFRIVHLRYLHRDYFSLAVKPYYEEQKFGNNLARWFRSSTETCQAESRPLAII